MGPRTILYTGKGGVGKTSVAACTARACAARGMRTLVLSTDPAHSLSDALGSEIGSEPSPVDGQLWGLQISAQDELERHWSGVKDWLGQLFAERGIDRISAAELTVPPGMDEVFSLLRLQAHFQSGEWEVLVVDCAPTGETLRLLSLPDVARWWIDKVFPIERQLVAAAAPFARSMLDIPLPSPEVFADIRRLSENLIAINEVLRDCTRTSVRLVVTPDRMVIGEAMRTFTYLNLYGYLTDAVMVNRIFPAEVGSYFGDWRRVQKRHLALVKEAFSPVPILRAPFFEREVIGGEMLDRLAETLFKDHEPAAILHDQLALEIEMVDAGARLRMRLPFVRKSDISLKKVGLELVVSIDGQRRTIALPPPVAALRPTGATFEDGTLEVSFGNERTSPADEQAI
jgi:arsenite/tail-anchored protein-transporting ATPase